jgi:hypothetical protein
MDIFAALVLVALGGILGVSAAWLYYLYDRGWKEDEAKREFLKQRVYILECSLSNVDGLISHYKRRIEQIDERLKKLEPTEVAE